jgi:hypothetical protein
VYREEGEMNDTTFAIIEIMDGGKLQINVGGEATDCQLPVGGVKINVVAGKLHFTEIEVRQLTDAGTAKEDET